jgi:hypothetical protein
VVCPDKEKENEKEDKKEMNFYIVKIIPHPHIANAESVTVTATGFEIVDGTALFYEKRELVAAIKNFILISKGVPQVEPPKEEIID